MYFDAQIKNLNKQEKINCHYAAYVFITDNAAVI